ncbi:MAG: endolytic transglycosylase MltG [Gallionella sp.]
MKKLFATLLLFILVAAGGLAYWVSQPLALPNTPFEFSLQSGSSLKSVSRQLLQAQLLPQETVFVWLGRVLGRSAKIKSGSYELEQPVSMLGLLDIITKGQVNQNQISVIEGWTFKQFRAAVNENPDVKHTTLTLSDAEILQQIGASETQAEGLFFPDTYFFAAGSSDVLLFKRAYQTMQQHLAAAWAERAANLPLRNPYEALTLASIVEKETGTASDRGMIAGVFVNRLRAGMLLQTDPTVIYGIGEKYDGNIRKRDLLTDTPYNTYTRAGLTPTPIALPGAASLQAALHPAKTDALYFVARGDGSSKFSSTLVEHNRAVNQYQK